MAFSISNSTGTKDRSRDAGMALGLLVLLVFLARRREGWLYLAIVLHIVNMIVPQIYRPFAWIWFGLSEVIGSVMSKVVLSVIFFVIVTPIGIVRRLLGKDSLQLRTFKGSQDSVMLTRNHAFTPGDLEKPY